MTTNIDRVALETRNAEARAELEKLRARVAVLRRKQGYVQADERQLAAAVQALVVAEAALAEEQATNPGTASTKLALDMVQNIRDMARADVLEAEEQLRLECFGFKNLKWTKATEVELHLAELRIMSLETKLIALAEEQLAEQARTEQRELQARAQWAELHAKRNRALAILRAEIDQAKQLQQLAVDDPLFGKLAKAPVKPKQAVVVKAEPTPVVVPEPVVVVEVSVTPPPAPEPANAKVEEPEHPVLKLFKNWQARNPAKPGMPRRQVAHAIDQAYTAK